MIGIINNSNWSLLVKNLAKSGIHRKVIKNQKLKLECNNLFMILGICQHILYLIAQKHNNIKTNIKSYKKGTHIFTQL
jgi:hypothetical protein